MDRMRKKDKQNSDEKLAQRLTAKEVEEQKK